VTKEWFESRKAQIEAASSASVQKVWFDPLAKRKFSSENTYLAFIKSKKYLNLVKKSGEPAPPPVIAIKKMDGNGTQKKGATNPSLTKVPATLKPISGSTMSKLLQEDMEEDMEDVDEESEWETASEDENEVDPSEWEKWDLRISFFDNHVSSSMEENLEYMWKNFGFYLPDSKYLKDPEGMLQYLGAKIRYGRLPFYESGLNQEARRMASLHGVQRHMIDCGKCKIFYDGNEEEYEDYYDYESEEEEELDENGNPRSNQLILSTEDLPLTASSGYELAIPAKDGQLKVLGSREFAKYYKQKHRVGDLRASAAAARVQSRYRQLTVPLIGDGTETGIERAQRKIELKSKQRVERIRIASSLRRNVNDNLPRNVPY